MTTSPRRIVLDVGIELGAACMPSELASNPATVPGVPASIKRIGSKQLIKGGDIIFPIISQWGAFCCHGNKSFEPICPKTLCSLSPTPMMLHIKFDQDWPTGFWDIQVQKCEIFVTQGQVFPKSNSTKLLYLSWLPATLLMIQSKINELAWRHHYKSMGNLLNAQEQLTP